MTNYDFSSLNDKEFEALSTDVLSYLLKKRIERFKPGKDGGVDGRFYSESGDEVIIQCKHWLKSGISALITSIKNTEAPKVKKLNPKRYIFTTSLPLSRDNKNKIKNIFSPYILTDSDILGSEDLNDILSENPEIVRKHYKLWISSTYVIQMMLSSAILGRSKYKLEEIIDESKKYVATESHRAALQKLETLHSVIITGSPGIGKTTLADQLVQYYTSQEYEFCFIENSLNEAEQLYQDTRKQVFYFDDFLGRNFLLALSPHQDSHVINFMKRIEKDKKKRFILTSRSNILNQGRRLSDLFEIKKIDKNEYELSINSLTDIDKAKILYNHIWFGNLSEEYIDQIYEEKRYIKIINHQNFNPRLISFITDQDRLSIISKENYWIYIDKTLSNPKEIWRSVFEAQIDDISRHIVVAVCLHGKSITEKSLKKLYHNIIGSNLHVNNIYNFDTTLRLLVGALLNRNIYGNDTVSYDLFNPSIADFIIPEYFQNHKYIEELLICLNTPESISNLFSLMISGVVSDFYFHNLLYSTLLKLSTMPASNKFDEFKMKIMLNILPKENIPEDLLNYIRILSKSAIFLDPENYSMEYLEFIGLVCSENLISINDSGFKRLISFLVFDYEKEINEFIPLSELVAAIDVPPSELTIKLKEQYIKHLSENITRDSIEADVQPEVYHIHDFRYHRIANYVEERFDELAIEFDSGDIHQVSDCCDIDEVIQSNIESASYDHNDYSSYEDDLFDMQSSTQEIDDIFDRS